MEIFLLLPVFMSIERYVQSLKLNIDSNTNTKNINIVAKLQSKMPIYAEKICSMRTLLKCAKNASTCDYAAVAYSHKTDMPSMCVVDCVWVCAGES